MTLAGLVVGLHLFSWHSAPDFNDLNPGVYLKTPTGYTAGTYFNSERKQSFYAGRTFNVYEPLDVTVGGITGYSRGPLLPMVVPSMSVPVGDATSLRVIYLPKLEPKGAHVLHGTWERKF